MCALKGRTGENAMDIKINDYYEPEHFKALNEANYDVSHTCDYEKNEMHHIHESTEILFVEAGSADYYVDGKKYYVEPGDILIIGSRKHHMRRIDQLPFSRYGLAVRPSYYRRLNLGEDLLKVWQGPTPEEFVQHFKKIPEDFFSEIIYLMKCLYREQQQDQPFRATLERSIMTHIAVLLYRQWGLKKKESGTASMSQQMYDIKEYIDEHYQEDLDLNSLSEQFYLHPVTISKEFSRCIGQPLTKYINSVRVCEGAKLLENTQESVTTIAGQCGYDSVNTFLRQFKTIMETSPLQYRKEMKEWLDKNK